MNINNNRSESFRKQAPSLSRQLSLPTSTEKPVKYTGGNIREPENVMNTSSLLEDPEPEALTIDESNYDEGEFLLDIMMYVYRNNLISIQS